MGLAGYESVSVYTYRVQLDIDDDRAYTHGLADLTDTVKSPQWSSGMVSPYDQISAPAEMVLTLNNGDGRYDIYNSSADYYQLLEVGRLIRVQTIYNGTTITMTELLIRNVMPQIGEFLSEPQVMVTCSDKMRQLLGYEYYPKLQQNVRIDEALTALHEQAAIPWPSEKFYFYLDQDALDGPKQLYDVSSDTDFEQAQTTLTWVGDHQARQRRHVAQVFIRDILRAEVYGFYFFQPRTAKYRFLNRLHAAGESSQATFTTQDALAAPMSHGKHSLGNGSLNDLTVRYEPRQQGTIDSVIYVNQNVPFSIAARSTRIVRGRFHDPDNQTTRIGASNVRPPVPQVDITANSESDGSGEDWLKFVITSYFITATSIEFTLFVRKVGDPVYITKLQARGRPLIVYNEESVQARDGTSVHGYGHNPFQLSLATVSDGDFAQDVADAYMHSFKTPTSYLDSLMIRVQDEQAADVQTLTIGDVITVHNADSSHNNDYLIVGEFHNVDTQGGWHDVRYTLRPKDTATIFTLDSSKLDGPHILAF